MLREENKTIILTTQFFDEAELLADRLMVLAAGMICGQHTFIANVGKLIAVGRH